MEELAPLVPVHFFQLSLSCHFLDPSQKFPQLTGRKTQYFLPNTSPLCDEEHFAEVAIGWSHEGIECFFKVDVPFEKVCYPEIQKGDSIEIFLDTRDVKTSGYNTRFCHHFFFLPEAIEGVFGKEITHFRTEDAHELCNPSDLAVKATLQRDGYRVHSFIPRECLYGYDPDQCARMGFSYRINRRYGKPQHFSVVSKEYPVEEQPSLWSSVRFVA